MKDGIDELVKNRNSVKFVIPANAGIQSSHHRLDPGVHRGDDPRDLQASIGNEYMEKDEGRRPAEPEPKESPVAVPGGVYLCQVGDTMSCGACCGLYNCADASRHRLQELLYERTEKFAAVPRQIDAIDAFRLQRERSKYGERPYLDFYVCPFLGFIGANGRRVGCLLHPLAAGNDGIDYRGLSFYGGLACRDYFCPSYRNLGAAPKEIIKAVCTDWYLYGLVITEDRLMGAFFGEIERRLGRPLRPDDLSAGAEARKAVLELLALKLDWPFRPPTVKGPGNYFFDDGLNPKPTVDYARLGVAPSRLDPILRELPSAFDRPEALEQAEAMIESLIARILRSAAAY
jgi:hypothetical protein